MAGVLTGEANGVLPVLADLLKLDLKFRSLDVDLVEYLDTERFNLPNLLTAISCAIWSNVLFLVSGTLKYMKIIENSSTTRNTKNVCVCRADCKKKNSSSYKYNIDNYYRKRLLRTV